jgi:hypothetical protein
LVNRLLRDDLGLRLSLRLWLVALLRLVASLLHGLWLVVNMLLRLIANLLWLRLVALLRLWLVVLLGLGGVTAAARLHLGLVGVLGRSDSVAAFTCSGLRSRS